MEINLLIEKFCYVLSLILNIGIMLVDFFWVDLVNLLVCMVGIKFVLWVFFIVWIVLLDFLKIMFEIFMDNLVFKILWIVIFCLVVSFIYLFIIVLIWVVLCFLRVESNFWYFFKLDF